MLLKLLFFPQNFVIQILRGSVVTQTVLGGLTINRPYPLVASSHIVSACAKSYESRFGIRR